jgi:hypothetical protein
MSKSWLYLSCLGFGYASLAIGFAGCKSAPLSHYISPRVEGRVLDGTTGEPLKGVEVRRVSLDDRSRSAEPGKGAEMMTRTPSVYTEADGTFVVASQRDVALFRSPAWYSITLSFRRGGYEILTTSYTEATNNASGEPVVRTGDVKLTPMGK